MAQEAHFFVLQVVVKASRLQVQLSAPCEEAELQECCPSPPDPNPNPGPSPDPHAFPAAPDPTP